MLELVKTFDLLGSIIQFLQERRKSSGITDGGPLHPRLVNQEKGGIIIYTWNDLSENVQVVGPVTHVGVYDPATQKHKVLWIYNQKVRIVSCSLNKERTLLGFTTVTKQDAGQEGKSRDIYQAFLTELQSQDPRVFSLNLQRPTFLKVQFLYPDAEHTSSSSASSARRSFMLIMLHKESVGLYQIHMARIGDRGIMMSGQPTRDQIVRKFVWCQWEVASQRLYYIHNVRQGSSQAESVGHKLSAIQFHSGGRFDNMIDVPINFPFPYIKTSTRVSYADFPLYHGIPDATLNAVVLSQANGSVCLCYQEHVSSSVRPRRTTSPLFAQEDDAGDPGSVDVNYYVCMVHHAKTLHGSATGLPRSLLASRRIHFHWFGDYLVVSMPGVFCHLLNVNLEYEPCHHILLHNHSIPTLTKPPVPVGSSSNGGNGAQAPAKVVTGSDKTPSTTTTSTDTSDPVPDIRRKTVEVLHNMGPQGALVRADSSTDTATEERDGRKKDSAQPTQSLSPPPAQNVTSPVPSPWQGLSPSPRIRWESGEVIDRVLLIDGECFKLGLPLVPCYGFSRETGVAGASVYDSGSGHIWRVSFNADSLVDCFKEAYWSTRLAILHYLILLKTRDILTIRQVFETLTADPTVSETTIVLSEYLVAATYASMRKKSDKETTQLLNFTTADTFRGQFEKSSSGERLARITYMNLDSVNISTKVSQERSRRASEDSWDLLRRCLRLKQMPPPSRFSHEHVLKALQKEIDVNSLSSKKWTWVKHPLGESFFDGMHSVKLTDLPALKGSSAAAAESLTAQGGERSRSRTETVLGSMPLFLQASLAKSQYKTKVADVTEQLLTSHLMHHLKKDSRIKAPNIAREYVACQLEQCQRLCHLLWSIHTDEDTTDYERLLPKLDEVGTDKEYKLFQVYERVYLVTQDLAFPRPAGFSSYFTSLGFKCLSFSLFLQYVDRGIVQLTPDFILQLLEDLPDSADPGNAETKFHVIARLPKPFAEDCLRRWHHPVISRLSAQQQVAQVLQEGMIVLNQKSEGTGSSDDRTPEVRGRTGSGDNTSSTSSEAASFKPLNIFIRHLEDVAIEIQRQKPGSSSLMYDTGIIEEAALSFTRHRAQCDLSTVNF